MQLGRRKIFTDVKEITTENVLQILRDAMITHTANAMDCEYLINYEKGLQPLQRVKTYRPDINVECIDNISNEITSFRLGYIWGNPITIVQRGDNDGGQKEESEGIVALNECYESENIRKKTQELAYFVEVTGIGYSFVDINTDWQDGDSYFKVETLDPRTSFIVYSSYYMDKRPMLGVTYRTDSLGNKYFTCFSKSNRYEVVNQVKIINGNKKEKDVDEWNNLERSGELNPLGMIPIIGWERASDRMGCFERQIPEMDNLNILISDFTNDVDQNTQAIWHGNDIEFDEDENGNIVTPLSGEWVLSKTPSNGRSPFINPLTITYDYQGILNNIVTRRQLILQKAFVPQRNDNSGGSTGTAMDSATGWSAAETDACREQGYIESAKMEEIKVALKAIEKSSYVEKDSAIAQLKYRDVQPNIKRQKSYELTTKINFITTGMSHGLDYKWLVKEANIASDPQQFISDSAPTVKRYYDSIFKDNEQPKEEKKLPDEFSQISNSPFIDGMKVGQDDKV